MAVTFDDDLRSHVDYALPTLRQLGVPAAFFLSGRALHGQNVYWFQQLETLLKAHDARGQQRRCSDSLIPTQTV